MQERVRASLAVFTLQKDQGYEQAHTTIEPIHQMSPLVIHDPGHSNSTCLLVTICVWGLTEHWMEEESGEWEDGQCLGVAIGQYEFPLLIPSCPLLVDYLS